MFRSLKSVPAVSIARSARLRTDPRRISLAASFYPSVFNSKSSGQLKGLSGVRYMSDKSAADSEAEKTEKAAADATSEDAAGKEAESQESDVINEWIVKYEKKDKESAKFKEAYQKAIADFRSLQRTTEQEVLKSKQYALQKFAKDLIESVDNFDLAIRSFPAEKLEASSDDVKEFYKGIHMVQQVLEKTLGKHGIAKVNPIGEKFDPNEHEALFQIPDAEKDAGTIIHVDRTGFKLHDRVLRAPKVGVVQDK
ncbi:Mge1 protein [Starmerella bacillaris]|uniref:GrpE protein homolog, mitochondrial n=1 Tax=Starmerella bacillaris TaxID=1247836 RepID=A0AAV5RR83_STABA|nr:Mge1 protein [Starmerella bacillaris]